MLAALKVALWTVAAVELAIAIYDVLAGGFHFQIGPLRLSSREAYKPFNVAVVAASLALWLSDRDRPVPSWERLARRSNVLAMTAAVLTLCAGIRWGVFAAGGADGYGYVSQASLWASGTLVVPEPLAARAPSLARSAAPLGYRPALTPGANVPIYAPGLPLLMALAAKVGGASAVYYVVPLLGGAAVWLTYLLGARVATERTGLVAAMLLACSPLFLFLLVEPMSDLPVTAWWLAAVLLAFAERPPMAFAAGVAAGIAVLIRPNLVPVAIVVALLTARTPPRAMRLLLFSGGLVPAGLAVAAINNTLYGSPLASGYGSLGGLFEWSWLVDNLQRYPAWLVELYTAGILLAVAGPFVLRTPESWYLLAFIAGVFGCYLFYIPFDDWPFLRFLLPAVPLLLILAAAVVIRTIVRLPARMRAAVLLAFCGLLASQYLRTAERLGAFAMQGSERRYATVGTFLGRELPGAATVVTVIQSGSVRWYGQRTTLRWDQIDPAALDRTIELVRDIGYVPFILLEEWEEADFRARFAAANALGGLDWPPAYEYHGAVRVRIWAVDDRARHVAGAEILTRQIATD